ncbi:MAG TPA: indolepyruvate oxidoreductase subunit beta [Rectinemataceae bacterium]|nr:indolepyruvate oxidoreductase subunit beta [Rectinemataceae bacterium]
MNYNIILAGVGGQGGLSISVVIARAAMAAGYLVKQSEVHGMSQRGGEVLAHLRISDKEIQSPTIPKGSADLVLAFEPLEALRYVSWLAADRGVVVSALTPIKNISDYPETGDIIAEIEKLPRHRILDAEAIAKAAGSAKAANVVLVGAAADLMPVPSSLIEKEITALFARKGEAVAQANVRAFKDGQAQFAH